MSDRNRVFVSSLDFFFFAGCGNKQGREREKEWRVIFREIKRLKWVESSMSGEVRSPMKRREMGFGLRLKSGGHGI